MLKVDVLENLYKAKERRIYLINRLQKELKNIEEMIKILGEDSYTKIKFGPRYKIRGRKIVKGD